MAGAAFVPFAFAYALPLRCKCKHAAAAEVCPHPIWVCGSALLCQTFVPMLGSTALASTELKLLLVCAAESRPDKLPRPTGCLPDRPCYGRRLRVCRIRQSLPPSRRRHRQNGDQRRRNVRGLFGPYFHVLFLLLASRQQLSMLSPLTQITSFIEVATSRWLLLSAPKASRHNPQTSHSRRRQRPHDTSSTSTAVPGPKSGSDLALKSGTQSWHLSDSCSSSCNCTRVPQSRSLSRGLGPC